MNIKKRLKESLNFALLEALLDEEYPTTFNLEQFNSLKTFSQRIKYCEEHLQRISSGSSRIVYKIDDTKVLKLSKNQKGLAQTEVEIQWGNDSYYGNILAEIFAYNDDNLWVEMELARKVSKSDFKRIVGCDIYDMGIYLLNEYSINNPSKNLGIYKQDKEFVESMYENEFVSNIKDFMFSIDIYAGDFAKLSTYGLVKRDGQDDIVIIDYGLTGSVYDNYYR